jgi:hypothetical protein
MRWGKVIEKWLGHSTKGEAMKSDEIPLLSEFHSQRIEKVCHDLGETEDRETIEMLMEDGLHDDAIEEVVKARNILSSSVIGDLDLEVEKMFAEGTLHRYGFDCIEEFNDKVSIYREHHHVSMK